MDPIFDHFGFKPTATIPAPANPLPNEHSARLREPGDFKEKPDWSTGGKFRRTAGGVIFGSKRVPTTIGIIWGQLKTQSGQAAAPQALRFPTRNWTEAAARKWLTDNSITFIRFEPAEPNNAGQPAQGPDPAQAQAQGAQGPRNSWFDIQKRKRHCLE